MLLGEYGVLEGGPALLAAVDRRAYVSLEAAEKYSVHAPGWLPEELFFELHPTTHRPIWGAPADGKRLALLDTVLRSMPAVAKAPVRFLLDSRALFDGDKKLGIGSSAALCVALIGAWSQHLGQTLDLADYQVTHFGFQGSGSGADVAVCHQGGVIRFSRLQPIETTHLPAGLKLAFVWTGLSASTEALLQQLAQYGQEHPTLYFRIMATLQDAADWAMRQADRLDDWLAALAEFVLILKAFAQQTGLPVFRSPHAELTALAERQGVIYKPMGAGGGDLGLVATDDADALRIFCAEVAARGLKVLELALASEGLKVRTNASK